MSNASPALQKEEADLAPASKPGQTQAEPATQAATPKQIIKTAQVRIQVEKLAASTAAVRKLTEQAGGYLSNSAETRSNYEHTVSMTIRVPAAQFEGLLENLLKQGVFVAENNVNAQDVTEEFVDIQTRLKTKRALETRYLELLRQAKTMKDILELEQALQQVREEIESREGRLKYLQSQVGYSTVTLVMYEQVPYESAPETGFWRKLAAGFGNGWGIFLDLVIGFVTLWPVWLVLAAAVWLFRRWRKRRREISKQRQ
jgi:hypothetical protein